MSFGLMCMVMSSVPGGVMRCSGGVEGMRGEASATNAMSPVHGGVSGGR